MRRQRGNQHVLPVHGRQESSGRVDTGGQLGTGGGDPLESEPGLPTSSIPRWDGGSPDFIPHVLSLLSPSTPFLSEYWIRSENSKRFHVKASNSANYSAGGRWCQDSARVSLFLSRGRS